MNFETYLLSKKIDSAAFLQAEPSVWHAWKEEFEQIHPNSFTAQKLYLINPVRRKYQLAFDALTKQTSLGTEITTQPEVPNIKATDTETTVKPKPAVPRPAFKPKIAGPVKEQKENSGEEEHLKPAMPKPVVARPVIAKPVIKPVETEDSNTENSKEEQSSNVPPEVAKPAKPVIPRPVMKPRIAPPVQKNEVGEEPATLSEEVNAEEQKPAAAKPVIPRPVIKPKVVPPVPDTNVPTEQKTETPHIDTPPSAEKPVVSKPAMARPVIKPPKPKTD